MTKLDTCFPKYSLSKVLAIQGVGVYVTKKIQWGGWVANQVGFF